MITDYWNNMSMLNDPSDEFIPGIYKSRKSQLKIQEDEF